MFHMIPTTERRILDAEGILVQDLIGDGKDNTVFSSGLQSFLLRIRVETIARILIFFLANMKDLKSVHS